MLRRENLQGLYPLSPMQDGMLFHALRDPDASAYIEQLSFRMHPAPSPAHFTQVWTALFQRHDILRTLFVHEGTERPLQAVLRDAPPRLRFEDLSALDAASQSAHLAAWKDADRLAGFQLTAAPPLRIACFDLGGDACEVVFTHHHILMDGWCLGILHQEFAAALEAVEAGRVPALPPTTPFARYIEWLGQRDDTAARRYWRDVVAQDDIASPLRESAAPATHAKHQFALDAADGTALRALCLRAGATPATLLHALWGLLLGRLLDREAVTFGSVISNRPEEIPGIEQMLGLFINTVPVQVAWADADSILHLLRRMQAAMLARRPHEYLPLATIQAEAGGRTLFDHLLLVQNYPIDQRLPGQGARIDSIDLVEATHYGLTVTAVPSAPDGGMQFSLDYDANRLPPAEAARLEGLLRHLVAAVLAQPDMPLSQLPLTSPHDAAVAETPGAPETCSLLTLFDAVVARQPDAIAVQCEGRALSYAALDGIANAVAHRLRDAVPLQRDDRVVLLARRNEMLPAAMLGIAKAGAAYVPVDPDYPAERIALLCRDSGARLVLAVGALPDAVPAGLPVVEIVGPPAPMPHAPCAPAPEDLLYVAYTSGSTGQPKGVMVTHRSVAAFAATLGSVFGLSPGDRILALTTITFDISVLELLCSLAQGLTVVMATEVVAADPELAVATMAEAGVTVLQATPSRLRLLLDAAGDALSPALRTVLVGGERLPLALAARLAALPGIAAFNVYGPTETTIWSTAQRLGSAPLSIGRPLPGERIVIVSRDGRPCPVGVVGEIGIGGVGLARGYLDQLALTASRHPGRSAAAGRAAVPQRRSRPYPRRRRDRGAGPRRRPGEAAGLPHRAW